MGKFVQILESLMKVFPFLEKWIDLKIATIPIKQEKMEQKKPLTEKRIEKKVVKEETELQIAKHRQKRKFKRKGIEVENEIIIDDEVQQLEDFNNDK